MLRFITPLVLIAIAGTSFFMFANPIYTEVSSLRAQAASYDEALNSSKALQAARDDLTKKSNAITEEEKSKIKKLLPDNIDNIRLILEIGQIAMPYGMVLKNVKYNSLPKNNPAISPPGGVQVAGGPVSLKSYGSLDLEFSTEGTYNNFINFIKSLESNLRIVDTSSIYRGVGETRNKK